MGGGGSVKVMEFIRLMNIAPCAKMYADAIKTACMRLCVCVFVSVNLRKSSEKRCVAE